MENALIKSITKINILYMHHNHPFKLFIIIQLNEFHLIFFFHLSSSLTLFCPNFAFSRFLRYIILDKLRFLSSGETSLFVKKPEASTVFTLE